MRATDGLDDLVHIDDSRGVFKVSRRSFTDPRVFEAERKAIFDKCWLYIGHESEVEKRGQFHLRSAGGRELIFNRDLNGKVNAFLNACPHRGARLCTARDGSVRTFFCYYHGWTFTTDGALHILPDREVFPETFNDDGSANMVAVPRLEHYRGLYFVCFDKDAVSLSDYLGAAKPYLDLCLDQGEAGMEVVEGTHDYASSANWKLLSENSVDGNHLSSLHSTYLDYVKTVNPPPVQPQDGASKPTPGYQRDLGNGHTVAEYAVPWGRVAGKWWPAWGEETKPEIEAAYQRLAKRVGAEKADRIANYSRNLLIFPNLAIVDGTGLTLRTIEPSATDYMKVKAYALAEKGESETARRLRLSAFVEFLGPGGLATPDDVDALQQCQKSYDMSAGMPLWNDLSKGSLQAKDWPFDHEGTVRCFWREWGRRIHAHKP
jgi:p-cumate 2,3-dioxygenase subunit alpha